jgi:hypothetical protein
MKPTLLIFTTVLPFALTLAGCGNSSSTADPVAGDTTRVDTTLANNKNTAMSSGVLGYYVGAFEAQASQVSPDREPYYRNKINISIDSIGGGRIKGHSVVAGNNRPFSGSCEEKNGVYEVIASEPGDDKYDGVFRFTLDPAKKQLEGTWEANNKKLEVTKRSYTLQPAVFVYKAENELPSGIVDNIIADWVVASKTVNEEEPGDAEERVTGSVVNFNASVVKLKKEDVENMYKGDLEIIRNSIYARHGYSFKNRRMRYIFDNNVDWYIPVTTDIRNELTAVEKANIDLIKRYEEHAEKYYDSYGR